MNNYNNSLCICIDIFYKVFVFFFCVIKIFNKIRLKQIFFTNYLIIFKIRQNVDFFLKIVNKINVNEKKRIKYMDWVIICVCIRLMTILCGGCILCLMFLFLFQYK